MVTETSKKGITRKQRKFLDDLQEIFDELDYDPSYEEIADRMDMSKSNVARYLEQLQERGFIVKGEGHRSIQIVEQA